MLKAVIPIGAWQEQTAAGVLRYVLLRIRITGFTALSDLGSGIQISSGDWPFPLMTSFMAENQGPAITYNRLFHSALKL
jgi:hypothetical protein